MATAKNQLPVKPKIEVQPSPALEGKMKELTITVKWENWNPESLFEMYDTTDPMQAAKMEISTWLPDAMKWGWRGISLEFSDGLPVMISAHTSTKRSTVIDSFGYGERFGLVVKFVNGQVCSYPNAPVADFEEMFGAKWKGHSVGSHFMRTIKPKYPVKGEDFFYLQ